MKQVVRLRSLRRRLQIAALVPAVILFFALLMMFTQVRLLDLRNDLMRMGEIVSSNLAPTLEYPLISGNMAMARQIIKKSLERSPVSLITIYDHNDNILAQAANQDDFNPGGELTRFVSPILQEPLTFEDQSQPGPEAIAEATLIGEVEVTVSDLAIDERRNEIIFSSIVVGISVLLLTFIFIDRVVSGVAAPLTYISSRIKALTRNIKVNEPPKKSRITEIIELEKDLANLATQLDASAKAHERRRRLAEIDRHGRECLSRCKSEIQAAVANDLMVQLDDLRTAIDSESHESACSTALRSNMSRIGQALGNLSLIAKLDLLDQPLQLDTFDLKTVVQRATDHVSEMYQDESPGLEIRFHGLWPEEALARVDGVSLERLLSEIFMLSIGEARSGKVVADLRLVEEGSEFFTLSVEVIYKTIPAQTAHESVADSRRRMPFSPGAGSALIPRLLEVLGGHFRCQAEQTSKRLMVQVLCARPTAAETPQNQTSVLSTEPRDRALPLPRALIVSTLESVRAHAASVIQTFGLAAEFATSEQDALAIVQNSREPLAAVLIDVMSPGFDGFELSLLIRQWEEERHESPLPIIGLTALPDTTEEGCLEAGMNGCVARPPRRDALRIQLSRALQI